MHPSKVDRQRLAHFTDLPNVGPAMAADLRLLGFTAPQDLRGHCPYALYDALCAKSGTRHDPCVVDVFISIIRFLDGATPQPWWAYTAERKAYLQGHAIPSSR